MVRNGAIGKVQGSSQLCPPPVPCDLEKSLSNPDSTGSRVDPADAPLQFVLSPAAFSRGFPRGETTEWAEGDGLGATTST